MFAKKILVMKQTAQDPLPAGSKACGICRLEKEDEMLTVCLSLIGFPALTIGEYRLYIVGDDKTVVKKTLGNNPLSCTITVKSEIDINKGVSAGLWTVKDDLPLLVAYKKSEDATLLSKDYGAVVINDVIAERKLREREKELFVAPPQKEPDLKGSPQERDNGDGELPSPLKIYNDEAVATENYYDVEDEINKKLYAIKENDEYIRREKNCGDNIRPQETPKSKEDFDSYQNETTDNGSENAEYFDKVKTELDGIFDKYPEETEIEKTIAGSRFAKVYYAENKYYVVGVIKEKGKEKYICYGVPSAYSETPPKQLAGYCSFVPLSIFDIKGDGYFMMFQDAATGKCVKKE